MYAIIADGGRQYRVTEGQQLDIDYREATTKGDSLEFERVLAVSGDGSVELGQPVVEGAKVTAEVLGVEQGDKLHIQKMRRRKTYRRRTGHRQLYTRVRINRIESPLAEKIHQALAEKPAEPALDQQQPLPQVPLAEKPGEKQADQETADQETADQETADQETADQETADQETADQETADQETADQETADQETDKASDSGE